VPGNHPKQRTLPNPGAGEDTHALPASYGEHSIYGAHASLERFVNHAAFEWVRRLGREWDAVGETDGASVIYWMPESVEDTPEQRRPDVHTE
jgi:hypothetical protein